MAIVKAEALRAKTPDELKDTAYRSEKRAVQSALSGRWWSGRKSNTGQDCAP